MLLVCLFIKKLISLSIGLPKPAIVPQARLLGAGNMFNTFGMTCDDILYEPLPFYHSAALLVGFGNVVTKGKISNILT